MLGSRHLKSLLVLAGKHIRPLSYALSPLGRRAGQTPATWARQYADDDWAYLWDLEELGHYSAIAGYVVRLKPHGAILDVGCGEGVLQRMLEPYYGRYLGIDLTAEAICRAQHHEKPTTTFCVADALTFEPSERFDAIIFNEVLYYLDDPAYVLKRFETYLNGDGIFVLSTSAFAKSLRVWRAVESTLSVQDEVVIYHRSGSAWVVQVAVPAAAGATDTAGAVRRGAARDETAARVSPTDRQGSGRRAPDIEP